MLCQKMIEQIKALREKVPVSLAIAKEVIGATGDLPAAIERAREIYAEPLTSKGDVSVDEACAALDRTKGDVFAAIELIGWKTDFAAKERAARPTRTETRKIIRGAYDIYELMDAAGTDDDLVTCPNGAPEPIVNLFAINTFHGLYHTDHQLLFSEYRSALPRIITALRSVGIDKQADHLEQEIEAGGQLDQAYQDYIDNERTNFRAVRSYCEVNLGLIHDWLYRDTAKAQQSGGGQAATRPEST
jgi:hypothetical protein